MFNNQSVIIMNKVIIKKAGCSTIYNLWNLSKTFPNNMKLTLGRGSCGFITRLVAV